ncbi:Hypothetical predicted protein [Cloeon dipterum]|uniref:Uncharacterized protein n=1 Tax=Cloeon dipterum TaxID=197152 RepID=A0A8S1DKR8_9INSE|nr:Hypothetical predicted protein [Cloeon dipterum]
MARFGDESNWFDLSGLLDTLDDMVSESDKEEKEVEPWLYPGVAEGVEFLIRGENCNEPTCGMRSCTLPRCRQGTLSPLGSLGPSIWKEDSVANEPDFWGKRDFFPFEWNLPTTVDPKCILKGCLLAFLTSSAESDRKCSQENQWKRERGRGAFGALHPPRLGQKARPLRGSKIPVYIKPLDSYKLKQRFQQPDPAGAAPDQLQEPRHQGFLEAPWRTFRPGMHPAAK